MPLWKADTIDQARLRRLGERIERDVEAGEYDGAAVAIAHRGEVVLEAAYGFADRATARGAQVDDVYRILSVTKAFTNVTAFQAIESGLLQLTTNVVEVIPEFRSADRFLNARRDKISLLHLLTHRSALPPTPNLLDPFEMRTLSTVISKACQLDAIGEPGRVIDYSPMINHALIAEMVRRVHGADSFREIVQRDVFDALDMSETTLGLPDRLRDRAVPIVARHGSAGWLSQRDFEVLNEAIDETAEMPWVGAVSTVSDMLRFVEMLRRGGEYEGTRLIAPGILERALENQTGDLTNNWWIPMAQRRGWDHMPANLGIGFFLRGPGVHPTILGTLTSPRTFGNYGGGTTIYWVDPERELSFVCLTAGAMEESANILRFQRLADIVVSSLV